MCHANLPYDYQQFDRCVASVAKSRRPIGCVSYCAIRNGPFTVYPPWGYAGQGATCVERGCYLANYAGCHACGVLDSLGERAAAEEEPGSDSSSDEDIERIVFWRG